jgi:CDGSH-type Zn-finger protein
MTKIKLEVKVVVSKNGPYLVTGNVPLAKQTIVSDAEGGSQAWKESDPFPPQASYALCRCGHSKNKPFCDGTHNKIKFDGTETASRASYREQAQLMEGPELALTDAESLCAFARFCDPNGQV